MTRLSKPINPAAFNNESLAEIFRRKLTSRGLRPGSRAFMKIFKEGEEEFFDTQAKEARVHENGENVERKLGNFTTPHLFKTLQGLGMTLPEDLDFATLHKYIDMKQKVGFVNSYTGKLDDIIIGDLIKEIIEIPEELRAILRNSLTCEFTHNYGENIRNRQLLSQIFTAPTYVNTHGLVENLTEVLVKKMEQERKDLNKLNRNELKTILREMPKYQRFLLLSMAGSFTNIHFDMSGTAVYYHVVVGRKIFYIIPNTEENRKILMDYQKDDEDRRWLGDVFFGKWERIVIEAGQTAFLPGGYIHFVYTPLDTIVVGGNFLRKETALMQFQLTKHEEEVLPPPVRGTVNRTHLFGGFHTFCWAYAKYILIPKLKEMNSPDEATMQMAKVFSENLCMEIVKEEKDWFSAGKKEKILQGLNTQMRYAIKRVNKVLKKTGNEAKQKRETKKSKQAVGGPIKRVAPKKDQGTEKRNKRGKGKGKK